MLDAPVASKSVPIFFVWQSVTTLRFSFIQRLRELRISIAWLAEKQQRRQFLYSLHIRAVLRRSLKSIAYLQSRQSPFHT